MSTELPDLKKGPPPIPIALVEWLEAVYPDRLPSVLQVEGLHRLAGQLDVVRMLRQHLQRQEKESIR